MDVKVVMVALAGFLANLVYCGASLGADLVLKLSASCQHNCLSQLLSVVAMTYQLGSSFKLPFVAPQ